MTNKQVIEAVCNNSSSNCSSSSLRWFGRNKILLYADKSSDKNKDKEPKSKWRIAMMFFDGVVIYNRYFSNQSSRYGDTNAFNNSISYAKNNGHFCLETRELCDIEINTRKLKSNWDYLSEYLHKSIPLQDFDLYWNWTWQQPLTAYAKETNDYNIKIESILSKITYSTEFNKVKQLLDSLSDINASDDIANKITVFTTMIEELCLFDSYINPMKKDRHAPYSSGDYYYSRSAINLSNPFKGPYVDNSDKTIWSRANGDECTPYCEWVLRCEFPEGLIESWDKLVAVFNRCGLAEPHPFGLKFCNDNIKTLAALHDTAMHDRKHPTKWYEYNTSNDIPSTTTTDSYPTTLLA
jgi:hypothetical protein